IVAILSLALGVAAATALFSVIYGVLIKPYPYKDPEKIWSPHLATEKDNDRWMAYPPSEYKQFAWRIGHPAVVVFFGGEVRRPDFFRVFVRIRLDEDAVDDAEKSSRRSDAEGE